MWGWRVNIDGRVYEGQYRTPTNAVFGAMRKDEIDRARSDYREFVKTRQDPQLIGVEWIMNAPQRIRRATDEHAEHP